MEEKKKEKVSKSPVLYIIMFLLWTILALGLWHFFVTGMIHLKFKENVDFNMTKFVIAQVIIGLNGIFITYFWLNGVKDFIYVIWFYIFKGKIFKRYKAAIDEDTSTANDRVLFLYCTCNDFDGKSLEACLHQDYRNYKTIILDDSSDEKYKAEVDEFAKEHNIKVVRRANRIGFKAGNINNYLLSDEVKGTYDYAVILDSDEIIPNDFIRSALKYFYHYDNVGIVQANHVSTRNTNLFMKLFHIGVNSHWPTYQTMKHRYGFSTMLGHGAMIKRECYEDVGGFPPLVAEDLCLSIVARDYGYVVAFAPEIVCSEAYPVDYFAFKKRHSKWTQGNLEFIKKFTKKIVKSKMKWYEKWDIVLFTYNLPLTAIFAFYIFVNLTVLPKMDVDLSTVYTWWMLIPTVIFFFSPMLNDFISWIGRINIFRFICYFFLVIILYGSMLTTSIISAVLGIFGKKAKFIVTPKAQEKITFWKAFKFQIPEFIFSTILLVLALVFAKSILPVELIISTGYLSFFLSFLSNKQYSEVKFTKDDAKTSRASLSLNPAYKYKVSKETAN